MRAIRVTSRRVRRLVVLAAVVASLVPGSARAIVPILVVNTNDSGPGSLRAAIELSNTSPGADTIVFAIPTLDPGFNGQWFTIKPLSNLPPLMDGGTTIDGSTQTTFTGDTNAGGPEIEVNGSLTAVPAFGLVIQSSSNRVHSLVVNGFRTEPGVTPCCRGGNGIDIRDGGDNMITGSYIGTDPTGTLAVPNDVTGIGVNTPRNRIGGTSARDRNVISASGRIGVLIGVGADETVIQGNYIGTNATGTAAVANGSGQGGDAGIHVQSNRNRIGGTESGAGNVISGNNPTGVGIHMRTPTGNSIQGNYVGTDAAGVAAIPNAGGPGGAGIVLGGVGNVIGGTTSGARNLISGNSGTGISVDGTGHRLEGNYVGTNASGTTALSNGGSGVHLSLASGVIVADNLISGNRGGGVQVCGFPSCAASGITVQGNRIGTNAAGTAAIRNFSGVVFFNTTSSLIAGNVISGGGDGINLKPGTSGIIIEGNLIGTTADGSSSLGNLWGIQISGTNNTVGGPSAAQRNVIAGATFAGVALSGNGNRVQGNYIGTNAAGTTALPNASGVGLSGGNSTGVFGSDNSVVGNLISGNRGNGVDADGRQTGISNLTIRANRIGTDASGAFAIPNHRGVQFAQVTSSTISGNLISGNTLVGIGFFGGSGGNAIAGNLIGTDATGTGSLPNGGGIAFFASAFAPPLTNNTIGGPTAAERNVISGNGAHGVLFAGSANVTGNTVRGNYIGVGADGSAPLGNGGAGVGFFAPTASGPSDNRVEANTIAYNSWSGVVVATGVRDTISRNSIFSNGGLGVDLGGDGVTLNDPGDADTGPNELMNYPVLAKVKSTEDELEIEGEIDTANPESVVIEFFANPVPVPGGDPSGHGEGAVFLGSVQAEGNGEFSITLPPVPPGTLITATATDAAGNTSEFAANVAARP